ncbi:MAG: sugar phosphate isomerase/epimerase family protein [Planctomycetota bacterium]
MRAERKHKGGEPLRQIQDRVGVSTHVLPGITLPEAIRRVSGAGFRTFEIVPADFHAVVGHPKMLRNAGVWPRTFRGRKREKLRKELEVFDEVTVHSPHLGGLNIASMNPGIREESQRQHREVLAFGAQIGARVVTLHPGDVVQDSGHGWEDVFHRYNVDFAKEAAEIAEKLGIVTGYESAEGDPELLAIVREVNSPRFGVHLDFANSYAWEIYPALKDVKKSHRRLEGIVRDYFLPEVHLHGAFHWWGGILTHQALSRNNCLDYHRLVRALRRASFAGPIVLEIQSIDVETVLADARFARDLITAAWNG